jgi:uncharacterized protein YacL
MKNNDNNSFKTELTNKDYRKAILYAFTMIFIEGIYMKYISHYNSNLYSVIYGTIVMVGAFVLIGTLITLISFFLQRRKAKNLASKTAFEPYWLQILKYAFLSCIIFNVIIFGGKIV